MVERFPERGPCELDPLDAPAEQRRFALYYYVATNWYDARGSGNRSMLPRCIWAAIRALHPSGAYDEPIPEAADYVPPVTPDEDTPGPDDSVAPNEDWLFL